MQMSRCAENLVELINQLKCFLHERRWILRQQQVLDDDNEALKDCVVPADEEPQYNIINHVVWPNDFEIKPTLICIVQQNTFVGLPITPHFM